MSETTTTRPALEIDFTAGVVGRGMEPDLSDGDTLFCRDADPRRIEPGRVCVLIGAFGRIVRRVFPAGDRLECRDVRGGVAFIPLSDVERVGLVVGVGRGAP